MRKVKDSADQAAREAIAAKVQEQEDINAGLPVYVAVYGTLRAGSGNHAILGKEGVDHAFIGAGKVSDAGMYNVGGFPCIIPAPGTGERIKVEVYALSPTTLLRVDQLEHAGIMYHRSGTRVAMDDGRSLEAQIYWWAKPSEAKRKMPRIPSGDWYHRG